MASQLINHSLQSSLCLLLFYLFYWLLLRKQPSLVFNRLYLLLAPLAAVALPFVDWDFSTAPLTTLSPAIQAFQLPEVVITANAPAEAGKAVFITSTGFSEYLIAIYCIVTVVLAARFCWQLLLIRYLAIDADALPGSTAQVKLLAVEESQPTFAFLNYIFLNYPPHLTEAERQQVLDHELAHVQLRHTLDVLYYELLVLLFWFNPAIWLLRARLLDVHEYQADARVLQKHHPQHYSSLLAKYTLYANGVSISSNFSRHQVFRRLHMLKLVGRKGSLWRQVMLLPVLCLMAFFFAVRQAAADQVGALAAMPFAATATNPDGNLDLQITWANAPVEVPVMSITWNNSEATEEKPAPVRPASAASPAQSVQAQPPQKKPVAAPPAVVPDKVEQVVQAEQEERPYTFVEQMPSFSGGQQAMFQFIAENIKYPEEAVQAGIQGQVFVSFVIWQDGSIGDVKLLRGLGAGTDEEAVRVVNAMAGKWEPGRQDGRVVPVRYNLPIRFKLN
ncbi:TonB family protein [Botryobacter ruber]|uniref:TonB family protein n=1 Tax=Botryobacter ruber TaxID=2171629 RepID=UPI000E0BC521|nr:M56 family metallopeptidase [Botryobacter ruber]